jgi:hypothetical protein
MPALVLNGRTSLRSRRNPHPPPAPDRLAPPGGRDVRRRVPSDPACERGRFPSLQSTFTQSDPDQTVDQKVEK